MTEYQKKGQQLLAELDERIVHFSDPNSDVINRDLAGAILAMREVLAHFISEFNAKFPEV